MPHIHTEPGSHDSTVSFYIVRTDTEQPSIMLHMHRRVNKWMMFGGHIEIQENPWQAVLHEVTEETGYRHDQLMVLQPEYRIRNLEGFIIHPIPALYSTGAYGDDLTHFHTDATYIFTAKEDPAGRPDEGESTDIIIVDLEQLNALPEDEITNGFRQLSREVLGYYIESWHPVAFSEFE